MDRTTRPNVVLLVLDTARARTVHDLLDAGRLPTLERALADARRYRRATSVAPWTVPAHASLFGGTYPADHGSSAADPGFDPPTTPLAERLRRAGYATAGLSANLWVSPSFGFDAGFDRFKTALDLFWGGTDLAGIAKIDGRAGRIAALLERTSPTDWPKSLANAVYAKWLAKRRDAGAGRLTTDAARWLRSAPEPHFLFCNLMEAHLPYEPPEPYLSAELPAGVDPATARAIEQDQWAYLTGAIDLGEREFEILRALYRAEIRRLDDRLGRLFDAAEATERETALVVVADHGENVGEHGLMDHQYSLHGTLLDVPLAVRHPPAFEPGRTDALVETRSLYATVLDLAGLDPPDCVAPSLADGGAREHAIAEYTAPQPSLDELAAEYGPLGPSVRRLDRALRSIRTDRWRLIEGSDGSCRLYDRRADPDETAPVDRPAIERRLRDRLAAERGPTTGRSDEAGRSESAGATRERLRDLGYL